jgi:hypothetical protein
MTTRSISIGVIDQGRVSARTRGSWWGIVYEMGVPPFIWFYWGTEPPF